MNDWRLSVDFTDLYWQCIFDFDRLDEKVSADWVPTVLSVCFMKIWTTVFQHL